ncbi:hypothetical protein GOP47_0013763 [Adiantum capillus-veneris]|uniref:Uncharacterized protein n=1 Tax=Adiantum capillus-veneris TaxID=13818 RepID=A0A9D4ZEV4_ADICA|nr:hypothetical protein GOP47_0013763 [Adiantum capillus-veneris]
MAVILPRFVTFKGDNERLLCLRDDIDPGVGTLLLDAADNFIGLEIVHEVIQEGTQLPISRFTVTSLGSNVVALRAVVNIMFCKRFTRVRQEELRAEDAKVTQFYGLIVGEPVVERELERIQYDLENGRVYDERLLVLASQTASNNSSFLGLEWSLEYTSAQAPPQIGAILSLWAPL